MVKFKICKKNWDFLWRRFGANKIDESIRIWRSMSRISNVVQIQNVERLRFSHVLIPYLNGYIKAVTLGLVFIYSTSIICSICPRETLHMCRVI